MNKYLQDRAYRRSMSMRDGRNRYGSRGGYVSSRKSGRDRAMDYEHDYPERDSRYNDRHYGEHRNQEHHMAYQQPREYYRPMDYEMYGYGIGGIRPMMNDYGYGRDYASEDMEKEYKEDLHEWIEKLRRHDIFGLSKQQVIDKAKQMGVRFDKFEEEEFYAIYLMLISDFKQVSNDPHYYLALAKEWLEDDDVAMKGSDKVCAYLYSIVLGKED